MSVAQTCAVQAIGRDNELPLYKLDIIKFLVAEPDNWPCA